MAFSKLGCDLVVLSEEKIEADSRLLCAIKTVEKIAVAVCASNGGLVAMVPGVMNVGKNEASKVPGSVLMRWTL